MPELNALGGTNCGVVWFDLTVPRTAGCYGWHFCCHDYGHEGDHECRHCLDHDVVLWEAECLEFGCHDEQESDNP